MPISRYIPTSATARPGVCTSSTRPVSPYEGQTVYETDTDRLSYWNGSAWVLFHDPTWVPITTSSLSNQVVSFACERNGIPAVGNFYAFGNGAATTSISLPAAGKLIAVTFNGTTDTNGTITVQPFLNGSVVSGYDTTITSGGSPVSTTFGTPLSVPANQRFTWRCSVSTATVGQSVITFYIRFD